MTKRVHFYVAKKRTFLSGINSGWNGVWSRLNKERVERLRFQGLLTAAGEAAISVAQNNGSWDALNLSDSLILTPTLLEVLKDLEFKKKHDQKTNSQKRIILEQVYRVKNPQLQLTKFKKLVTQG